MGASITWDGLAELQRDLRDLPRDLTTQAAPIVDAHAERARGAIAAAYPHGATGRLSRSVIVIPRAQGSIAGAYVRATAPQANLIEGGTSDRYTTKGWARGSTRAAHIFRPIEERERIDMYNELKALLAAAGFVVTGDES